MRNIGQNPALYIVYKILRREFVSIYISQIDIMLLHIARLLVELAAPLYYSARVRLYHLDC